MDVEGGCNCSLKHLLVRHVDKSKTKSKRSNGQRLGDLQTTISGIIQNAMNQKPEKDQSRK